MINLRRVYILITNSYQVIEYTHNSTFCVDTFSASKSAKFREEAKMSTSAIITKRCRNEIATSTGIPCVGSKTSNSF